MILLDTNVISELVRPAPDQAVGHFLRSMPAAEVFTAAICEAEIRYGLARMADGRRRSDLTARIAGFLDVAFGGRILAFDRRCASFYGEVRAAREAVGRPIGVEDAMIAATARAYGAVLVTRNVADFADSGADIVNPWMPQPPHA